MPLFVLFLLAAMVVHAADARTDVCIDLLRTHVSEQVVEPATFVAKTLLDSAAIDLHWKISVPGQRERVKDAEAWCPAHVKRINVVLTRIHRRGLAERVLAEASMPNNIVAYYHRIEDSSRRNRVAADVLLGHVLAHEIGHLLLGSPDHAADGLMQREWSSLDYSLMTSGKLNFNSAEAFAMHPHPVPSSTDVHLQDSPE